MRTSTQTEAAMPKSALPRTERTGQESRHLPILRWLLIAGIVFLLFIPTYIAVLDYMIHKDSPASERITQYSFAALTGPGGQQFTFAPEGEAETLAAFSALVAGGDRISTIPPDLQSTYLLTMTGDAGTENYRIFCNAHSADVYYADDNGNCFRADAASAGKFLNAGYAFELYTQSATPTLTTAATDEIIPSEIEWFYRTQNGNFCQHSSVETTQELRVYPIANDVGFTFSLLPDHYTITVTQNGVTTVYANQSTFTTPQLAETERLDVTISATYEEESGNGYYGSVTYRFQMNVVEAAQFTPSRTSMTEGGFLVLTCKNVKNAQKLQITAEPALSGAPVIFSRGDIVYAAIPAGDPGVKQLSVTYGTIKDSFALTVTQRAISGTVSAGICDPALASAVRELVAARGAVPPTATVTPGTLFADYTASGAERIVSFGSTLRQAAGEPVTLPFELYRVTREVTALSPGIVAETGVHPVLGNYVILDHGCGLCTWYAGLAEIRTEVGAILAVGDTLGIAGTILGDTGTPGSAGAVGSAERRVLILATLGEAIISPDELRRTQLLP